ncbi:MAG: hypothetical protein PHS54_02980 [Clostridia bacterium]|nr:hypothetical protein [Clostridia bacterium]
MTTEQLTKEQREKIIEIAEYLYNLDVNIFSKSNEGYTYWYYVFNNLLRIANSNKKKCPKCGEVLE